MQAKEQFINEQLREPTLSDLARMTGLPQEDILFALDAIQEPMSLHEPIYSDGGDPVYMMDQLKDNAVSEERWLTYVTMKENVMKLDERQQKILAKRFYYGETQTEIANELGISQAQISRLEKSAIKTIQKQISQYDN